MDFLEKKVPFREFLQGYTHLLGKSSGVNAILLNSSGVRRKVSPQPGGGGGEGLQPLNTIAHSDSGYKTTLCAGVVHQPVPQPSSKSSVVLSPDFSFPSYGSMFEYHCPMVLTYKK